MTTNYQLIRYQADNIPNFDGNSKQVNRFISSCDNFLSAHRDANANAPINVALFDTVLSKLVGRAADLIASRIELNTWTLVIEAIIATFSDQRSIDCIIQDILTLKPDKNESPLQFGIKIQDARSLLFSKVNTSNDIRELKLLKISEYGNLAMKTFISGLNYHMQLVVRLKNPNSLEEAIALAQEEENYINYKNRNNATINKSQPTNTTHKFQYPISSSPMHRPFYSNPMHRPFYSKFQHTNPLPYASNFPRIPFQNRNTPFANLNQSRPNSYQFRNNHQMIRPNTFNRPPSNQFRQNPASNQFRRNPNYQPAEPMDTSSGNTIINKPPNPFKPTQPRNFRSEELFNQRRHRPRYLSHAKRALYYLSYAPYDFSIGKWRSVDA
ncbi:hypothetical protein HUJ04_010372, partial [Dendroctonus ponderosae]